MNQPPWNQEFEIRIVTTLPLKRCAWALSPPTASHLQGLILLERGDAQYVSHPFEDRELQQTAGINYYMRDIVHVIDLFDQKVNERLTLFCDAELEG